MSKEMWVIVLGIAVVIIPYLGVPGSWKTALFVIAGAALAGLGFLLRGEALGRSSLKETERSQAQPAASSYETQDIHYRA